MTPEALAVAASLFALAVCVAYTLREPNDELREAVERVRNTKGGAK